MHHKKDLGNERVVEDFFLEKSVFNKIKADFIGTVIPFYPSKVVIPPYFDLKCEEKYNFQMVHIFYDHTAPFSSSPSIKSIAPLLEALNAEVIIKVKANLVTCTETVIEHGYHQDLVNLQNKLIPAMRTAVFYINSNDGYTSFEDGQKVESVENRFLSFPTTQMHTGTTCTNEPFRIVLNINYIPHTVYDPTYEYVKVEKK